MIVFFKLAGVGEIGGLSKLTFWQIIFFEAEGSVCLVVCIEKG